jgi:hypothetical protein
LSADPAHRTKKEEEKETERKKESTCVYFEKSVNKSDKSHQERKKFEDK